MRVAAVGIGGVEKAQAVVVSVQEQVGETLYAEGGLVRMVAGANGAGARGEAAGLDAGLAEGHGVRGAELARERGKNQWACGKGGRMDPGGTSGAGGAMEEFAAFHGASVLRRFRE